MRKFVPVEGGYSSDVDTAERQILLQVAHEVWNLISEEGTIVPPPPPSDDDDPIAHLDFSPSLDGQSAEVDLDPALERVFPPMSVSDPELASEMRSLTLDGLRLKKLSNLLIFQRSLARRSEAVVVQRRDTGAWLSALTDMRLVLASHLGIEDDKAAEEVYDLAAGADRNGATEEGSEEELRQAFASLYAGITWWQESLLSAVAEGERSN